METFAILAGVFCAVAIYDLHDGILFLGDIDDRLRAVEIRQFLSGKGWFDLTISGIAMPEPYVSAWSRLIDAPYAAMAWGLSFAMAKEQAISAAFYMWPPLLMLGFVWLSALCMRKLMPEGARPAPLHVFVAALAMVYAALEFVPGRIDHHNAQLVMLVAATYGVLCWSAAGGVWVAVALSLSLNIGLETLPMIAVLWAGLALAWVTRCPGADAIFKAFSSAMVVLPPLVTLIFSGPHLLFSVQNDIGSAPYVAAFSGFGLFSTVAVMLLRAGASIPGRLAALAVPGSLLLVLIAFAMPGVLAGPYVGVDPLSRSLWLDRVNQEHSILMLLRMGMPLAVFNLTLQAVIILGAGLVAWRSIKAGKAAPAVVLAMGVAAFLANLEAFRFIRFPAAILPLFIPQLLAYFTAVEPRRQKGLAVMFGGIALAIGSMFQTIAIAMPVKREPDMLDAADFLMSDTCSASDRKAMASLPAGRYMVTPMVGMTFLEQASAVVEIAGISFHRAAPGLHRMLEAFYLTDPACRQKALSPFDYLAFCAYPDTIKALFTPPAGSLFEALLNDKPIDALVPLSVAGSRHLKLYRIDHDRF
jgi:hypothetical protein